MTRTIAVTGGGGFLGSVVVRKLTAMPDTRVVAVARRRPEDADRHAHWIESSLEELTPSHWEPFGPTGFDALLHLAAFTPKVSAERDHAAAIVSANVVGLQVLFASLRRAPRRFVFSSTLDVYSPAAFERPIDERSPLGPAGLYGLSKLFGEGLARTYARSAGVECLTLRIGHVYGPGEERYGKLVPETIRRVLADQPPRIVGDGSERRDLIYVDDAAEALVRSCVVSLGGVPTINVASGRSYSIREIVETIAALAGYTGDIEQLPRSGESYSTVFDTSLMKQVLGTWPLVSLTEGLAQEIARVRHLAARDR